MIKHSDSGFTSLEAAIVLIPFVVVAAVFSYVVLSAGFFTTQMAEILYDENPKFRKKRGYHAIQCRGG